jgi:hypothetical protein
MAHSSSRENLLEHVFIAEVLQETWFAREQIIEVLRAEVDAGGYDLVFECGPIVRHIQLKASEKHAATSQQTINTRHADNPSACIVWLLYEERQDAPRIDLSYLWFGSAAGEPLPALGNIVGRNPRSKTERPNTRVLKRSKFEIVPTTAALVELLFGSA